MIGDSSIDWSWQKRASCAGKVPVSEFFQGADTSVRNSGRRPRNIATLKELCRTCPVKFECSDHANNYPEKWGVWAGETETERMIRRREKERLRRKIR